MQIFPLPLDLTDVSILLGLSSIIMIVTAELFPSIYLISDFAVDRKRLENAGIVTGIFCLLSVVIRIIILL